MNRTTLRRRHGISRPRNVAAGDTRSPMLRLLQDGTCHEPGMIVVNYDAQWRTLIKAQRLGYLDDRQFLTDKGREFLAKATAS